MNAKKTINLLTSMKASIVLFIALGIIASFGTLIPQGLSNDAIMEQYGAYMGQLILTLGLDDLYHTWWFIALGLILTLQIAFCTVRRLKSIHTIQQAGSIILHLSMLLIIIGACVSGLYGDEQLVKASIGETVHLKEGNLEDTSLKINNFRIEYYDNGMPSQYICDLTLTEKDGKKQQATISVNHPYKSKGVKIYQRSFGWESYGNFELDGKKKNFQLRDNEDFPLENGQTLRAFFIPDFDEETESLESKSNQPNNPMLAAGIIKDGQLVYMKMLKPGETTDIGNGTITFDKYQLYTGLNVKEDKGIAIIFAGFAVAILGLGLRYLPAMWKREEQ